MFQISLLQCNILPIKYADDVDIQVQFLEQQAGLVSSATLPNFLSRTEWDQALVRQHSAASL